MQIEHLRKSFEDESIRHISECDEQRSDGVGSEANQNVEGCHLRKADRFMRLEAFPHTTNHTSRQASSL